MQLRQRLTKMPRVYEKLAHFKAKLQIGRVTLYPFARIVDENLGVLLFRDSQVRGFFRIQLVIGAVGGQKLLMLGDFALEAFHSQIGNFSDQSGITAFRQIGGILVPGGRGLDVVLLLVERAQAPRKIDIFRLRLMKRIDFRDLFIERFPGQLHPALLLE